MVEVVEEGFAPIVFLSGSRYNGIDLISFGNEFKDSGKEPPFFNSHLCRFAFW